nr:hypothetical protein [Candidatus Dependentiae bacterium]
VRVGCNKHDSGLPDVLDRHFLNGTKDSSIFRKHIGRTLLARDFENPHPDYWELNLKSDEARESSKYQSYLEQQNILEQQVSEIIRNNFSFCVLQVNSKDERIELESAIIATVAQCEECRASENWFGRFSPKYKIKAFGLWHVNGLNNKPLENWQIKNFEEYLEPEENDSAIGEFEKIKLSRTACYGPCPIYDLEISADGNVDYTGNGFVSVNGNVSWKLDTEQIKQLNEIIQRYDYFNIKARKITSSHTDAPGCITSVKMKDGRFKKINNYYGEDKYHGKLRRFEWRIDEITGADRFGKEYRQGLYNE